jgi:formate hydrogenlyase transcriptional activator
MKRADKIPNSPTEIQQFKDTLFELSAQFISVPAAEIGQEIDEALRLIGRVWNLDWILFSELSDDRKHLDLAHSYAAPGFQPPSMDAPHEQIPWLLEKICRGETILLARLPGDLPVKAKADRKFCSQIGIRSSLTLPFAAGESGRGALSVLSLREERTWTDEQVKALRYAGQLLINALERKKTVLRIQELVRFEHLLSEVSATYINLPRDDVERVLKEDFARLSSLLDVDRCVLYRVDADKRFSGRERPFVWSPEEDAEVIRQIDEWTTRVPNAFENLQYFFDRWYRGEHLQWSWLEELPPEAEKVKRLYTRFGVKSGIALPISVAGVTTAALVVTTVRRHRSWADDLIPRLRLFGEVFANALMRKRNEEEIQNALSEIRQLKERVEADYMYLREEADLEHDFGDIVGRSDALKRILVKVKQVAPTNATVLLLGETGTGKGLIARAIHNASQRRDRPLMQVNCAALAPTLIESELFGHEKGAFTGAAARRVGRFEAAHGTTLFLDEIGDLPLELQPKLLRVLQDGEFERVGGTNTVKTDVRVVTATNRDLEREVEAGRFRRDLWYRLSIFPISIPPLRERLDDIPLFLSWFVGKYGKWIGKKFDMVPQKTIKALERYAWPGNIRELENLIERAVITSPEGRLQIELPETDRLRDMEEPAKENDSSLRSFEREHILNVLEHAGWIIEGPKGAARQLGLRPSTLRFRMQKLDIKRPSP